MDKREEIREGVITNLVKACPEMLCADIVKLAEKILKDEASQGVVIKKERKCPGISSAVECATKLGVFHITQLDMLEWHDDSFEPLIEEK